MAIDKVAVGNRLRQFAVSKKMKIKDLALAVGMHPSALQSNYLNGRNLPGAELLIKLQELDCDITWLLSGKTTEESKLRRRIVELETEIKVLNEHFDQYKEKLINIVSLEKSVKQK